MVLASLTLTKNNNDTLIQYSTNVRKDARKKCISALLAFYIIFTYTHKQNSCRVLQKKYLILDSWTREDLL